MCSQVTQRKRIGDARLSHHHLAKIQPLVWDSSYAVLQSAVEAAHLSGGVRGADALKCCTPQTPTLSKEMTHHSL